jgi:glycerophosphoryl diester phosphodiesterase
VPRLRTPPIGFAHRGASAHAPENTLEAFRTALRMGARGLESDVWITSDGVPVLDHDGVVDCDGARHWLTALRRAELPAHVPTLAELYAECGTAFELSLDVKDPAAAPVVVEVARAAGTLERLWLCHPDWRTVASWRAHSARVRLVDSTRLRRVPEGMAVRAAALEKAGVDAFNLHHSEWTPECVAALHARGRCAFAWDLQEPDTLARLLAMEVDAVYSDWVDRMEAALVGVDVDLHVGEE